MADERTSHRSGVVVGFFALGSLIVAVDLLRPTVLGYLVLVVVVLVGRIAATENARRQRSIGV